MLNKSLFFFFFFFFSIVKRRPKERLSALNRTCCVERVVAAGQENLCCSESNPGDGLMPGAFGGMSGVAGWAGGFVEASPQRCSCFTSQYGFILQNKRNPQLSACSAQ